MNLLFCKVLGKCPHSTPISLGLWGSRAHAQDRGQQQHEWPLSEPWDLPVSCLNTRTTDLSPHRSPRAC